MAIKWSPLAVSKAMDKVEAQVALAESFIQEANRIAKEALAIPNLPGYMEERLETVARVTEGAIRSMREEIDRTRRDLPEKDLRKEQARADLGTEPPLFAD